MIFLRCIWFKIDENSTDFYYRIFNILINFEDYY